MSEENQATDGEKPAQQFMIQRIYMKDLSVETPMGPEAFLLDSAPNINQDIATEINKMSDGLFEVVLTLTVSAKTEDKTVFLIEIQQAGLFVVKGIEDEQLTHLLNTVCLQTLFPYAREVIDSSLVKATLAPLMLPPINFDVLFSQAVQERKATAH